MPPRRFSNFKIKNLPQRRKGAEVSQRKPKGRLKQFAGFSAFPLRLSASAVKPFVFNDPRYWIVMRFAAAASFFGNVSSSTPST